MNSALPSLLLHLAQATLFGGLVVIVLLSSPFATARFRHVIGWFGLVRFILPLGLLAIVLPTDAARLLSAGWFPAIFVTGQPELSSSVPPAAHTLWRITGLVWLVGVAVLAIIITARALRFMRQLRADRQPFTAQQQQELSSLAARAGVNPSRITGWVTTGQTSPGVSGIFRSRIHVPRELLHNLSRDEVEAVLLHELVHVARKDNLWRMLQTVIVCLCWFHPLTWWLHRRLLLESERACDEAVVRLTRKREAYAHGLFKSARFALGMNVPGFSGMARHGLKARIATLLKPNNEKDYPMLRLASVLITLVGLVLTAGAVASEKDQSQVTLPTDYVPRPLTRAQPEYPKELRAAKIEGEAVISLVVDSEGMVRDAKVASATLPAFGEAALAAVQQWTFLPGVKGGRNVNTRLSVPIVFTLPKGE